MRYSNLFTLRIEAPVSAPNSCDPTYKKVSNGLILPVNRNAIVTAGLKWPPLTLPRHHTRVAKVRPPPRQPFKDGTLFSAIGKPMLHA